MQRNERSLLFEVARLHYEEDLTQARVAERLGLTRVKVNRLLQEARQEGIVQFLVVPRMEDAYLRRLEADLVARYELLDSVLVPGREEILDDSLPRNAQQALVERMAQRAAFYLDRILDNNDVMCINWGRVMRSVVDHLRPSRMLRGLQVLPFLGMLSSHSDAFEANLLAREVAQAYGGDYDWLISPAIVRDLRQREVVQQLPLVQEVLGALQTATVAITAIAPADPKSSTIVRRGLLAEEEVTEVIHMGAIGEICSWWFDQDGEEVQETSYYPIGLGLSGLQRMVKRRKRVIGVVGADRHRFDAIYAALRGRLINVLVTDHITAQYLLSRR